jgi:hypothetical protein
MGEGRGRLRGLLLPVAATGLLALALGTASHAVAVPSASWSSVGAGQDQAPLTAYVRVIHADPMNRDRTASVTMDGTSIGFAPWSGPTPWTVATAGVHRLEVRAGSTIAEVDLHVSGGCRVTVLLARQGTRSSPFLVPYPDCITGRIPDGEARVSNVIVADPDLGSLVAQVAGTALTVVPQRPIPATATIPAGLVRVTIRMPATGEILSSRDVDLAGGSMYTVLYTGGGETNPALTLLKDGSQPPRAPIPGEQINTGLAGGDEGPSSNHGNSWASWSAAVGTPSTWAVCLLLLAGIAGVPRGRGLTRRRLSVVVLIACVVSISACTGRPASSSRDHPSPSSAATSLAATTSAGTSASPGTTAADRFEPPARLRVARVGLDKPVGRMTWSALSALPAGLRVEDVSWIDQSTVPGRIGTAVVVGHTTFTHGGAFARLGELRRGDLIIVEDQAATRLSFAVDGIVTEAKGAVPDSVWGPQVVPMLALLTCTGPPEPRSGLHSLNLVVLAHLTVDAPGRRQPSGALRRARSARGLA